MAHSTELDSRAAAAELLETCVQKLGNITPDAGILYAGIDADHQLILDKIMGYWPGLQLIGCTTDGEFSNAHGYSEDSMVLILLSSETCSMASGYINNSAADLEAECGAAYRGAVSRLGQEPKLCILFSDVLRINGELVIEQLTRASGSRMPIIGGMSGDSWRFGESKQFCNGKASSGISSFLILGGEFDFSCGMDSGWEPYGDMGTITRAEGNVVYEINHKPALEFYWDILGEGAKPSLELPIAIHDEKGVFRFMRTSFENYDLASGSVTYLGNAPVNNKVRITMVSRESILAGAASAIDKAVKLFPADKAPALVLCFSCSARRVLLGTRTKEEYGTVSSRMSPDIPLAGFYTYGEICPRDQGAFNEFHNETFVAVLLG